MKRRLLPFIVALVLATAAVPAFAAPPETTTEETIITNEPLTDFEGNTLDCADFGAAYPFNMIENAVRTDRVTTYVDKQGNPIRTQVHVKYTGSLTNSVTGYSVSDTPDSFMLVFDHRDQTLTVVGLTWSINLPGEGHVVLNAGRLVFDPTTGEVMFMAGPHAIGPNPDSVRLLCSVLD